MLSMLAQGNTGSEILSILDALTSDQVGDCDVIESPVIGVPTLEKIAFWCSLTVCPLLDCEGHLC